jgi:antitoxin MazE
MFLHRKKIMELQVNRWGNSLAVRLPAQLVRDLDIQEGSVIQTEVLGAHLLRIEAASKVFDGRAFVASLRAMHGTMPVTQPIVKEDLNRY